MKTVEKLKDALIHLPELLIVFFSPAALQLAWVVLAIITDTITGIWAARKAQEKIHSRRLADVIPKMLVYVFLILLCHLTDRALDMHEKFGVTSMSLVTLALAGIEIKSIDENFTKATGKGIFKGVINALKRK